MGLEIAERLPKVLIHRNVHGEGVHRLLAGLDEHWARQAPQAAHGVRQRFVAPRGRCGTPGGRCSTARRGGAWAS